MCYDLFGTTPVRHICADICAATECGVNAKCVPNAADGTKATCTCDAGWRDADPNCEARSENSPAVNPTCVCDAPQCPDYSQAGFVPSADNDPCFGRGNCTGTDPNNSIDPWICNAPCTPDPCLNGGFCYESQDLNDFICQCTAGWTGASCDQALTNCSPNPCENGGTCLDNLNFDGYTCTCAAGWGGANCTEQNICAAQTPCQNGGICHAWSDNTGFCCQCTGGWSGVDCNSQSGAQRSLIGGLMVVVMAMLK